MKLKDYIELNKFDRDDKFYHKKILDYFGVDSSNMTAKEVIKKSNELIDLKPSTIEDTKIKINGKKYYIEDILKSSYNQWVMLEEFLKSEEEFITNLHKVLSIYLRPMKWSWLKLKYIPIKWDNSIKEEIENDILEMDMNDALGLNVFFYQREKEYIKNTRILYLNRKTMIMNQMMKSTK